MATGISTASAPTLFMKAEQTATIAASPPTCSVGCLRGASAFATRSTAPALLSARLATKTAATVITAGWRNNFV